MASSAPLTPEIIGRALDLAPLTRQLKFIIGVAAAGFFFDSFDIVIMSYALPSIRQEFHLDTQQVGLLGSAALGGMAVGSWAWGWIADRWGRRMVFAATVLMFSFFTGFTALAFSLGFLVGSRFLTGLGLGGMVPIDAALVAEFAPARIRGRVSAMLPLCWPIGIFAAAGVSLLVVPTIGWRWLFVIGVVPALLAFIIRRGVPESPRWLAMKGRTEEARASLDYVGVTDATIDQAAREIAAMPPRPAETAPSYADLLKPQYAKRMIHTWLMWFLSAAAGTTFSVWLPTIYATFYNITITRTLFYTFIVAGTQVVGRIVAFSVVDKFGRKPLMVVGYGVAGCAALLFTQASTEQSLLLVAMLYAFFADMGSLGMTVYTPEVYPLKIRGLATSLAMGVGRVGGMVAPIVVGIVLKTEGVNFVWFLMGGLQLASSSLTLLLAYETRGRNLELVSHAA